MNLKPIGCLATLFLIAGRTEGNEQPGACAVYFSVLENDEFSGHPSPLLKMNEPQRGWYEKYGSQDKYVGICYIESGARAPADEPLYAIVWGEHLVNEPYAFSNEAAAQINRDENAAIADPNAHPNAVPDNAQTSVPVSQASSRAKKDYGADGWLAVWNPPTSESKGGFLPITPLRNHSRTDLALASTSLLEDGMEQICQREKARLAAKRKGWAVLTIRPTNNPQLPPNRTPSATPQSSLDAARPPVSSATQAAALDPPPAQLSGVTAVSVSSTLPGADIFIDGDFVGNTPSTINVAVGRHVITVKKTGFQDWVRIVNFSGGAITLNAELTVESGEISSVDPPARPDSSNESATAPVSAPKPVGWIGVSTKNDGEGALVLDVTAHGPAARAGIHVGDVILELDGRQLKGKELQTVVATLKPGTRVPIRFASGSSTHEVWITVTSHE